MECTQIVLHNYLLQHSNVPHVLNVGTIWHAPETADRPSYQLSNAVVNEKQLYNSIFIKGHLTKINDMSPGQNYTNLG